MSDAYIGEIRLFAGNFAPVNWALCYGQLLPITQNTALFSILGTQYGGDGKTNFALPDLRGRVPIHQGQGPGLTDRVVGEEGGSEYVTLLVTEMPGHNHTPQGVAATGVDSTPSGGVWGQPPSPGRGHPAPPLYIQAAPDQAMSPNALGVAGNSMPHNNMQPYVAMNYIICLNGMFPPRD